jgi:hypothetical protein
MSRKSSAGVKHHHDSTAECPGCGRRFVTHCTVAQHHGYLTLSFESKQKDAPGRWGVAANPLEDVTWADSFTDAWRVENAKHDWWAPGKDGLHR